MGRTLGEVAVDSGLLLVIDPCYIFNDKEWKTICKEGHKDGGDIGQEILDMLMKRIKKTHCENEKTALVFRTEFGDGSYAVMRYDNGVTIEDA